MKKYKIGFIGQGWIGKNYADDFEKRKFKVIRYSLEEPYIKNKEKIANCDIVFIAVPTPTTDKGFDDSILRKVIKEVGKGKIAVIKSTLLPGRTELIQKENPDIFVFHSPEFLRELTASEDAAHPNRNIIGMPTDNQKYYEKAEIVLSVLPNAPFNKICDSKSAEFIKYIGNIFLHHKVIFFNMIYDFVNNLGLDYELIKQAVVADPRIGESHTTIFHKGGRGSGGHCFIKDKVAFMEMYKEIVGDQAGTELLESFEKKNIDLLINSNKDLDLLKGVYGETLSNYIDNNCKKEKEIIKKKTILLTGGAGFIGFNLAKKLLDRGDDVVIVDNFNDYYDPQLKKDRVKILQKNYNNVKVLKIDISNYEEMKKIFKTYNFDKIVNLAAQAGVRYSLTNPFVYQQSNVQGFLNLIELAKENNIKDIVYASSSSVYGNSQNFPLKEDQRVDTPISLYASTKKTNEENAYVYHHLYGMNFTGLRFFTVYGPWGRPDMALFKFVKNIINNQAIDVYNNGELARDFTYIDDIVAGVIASIDNPFPYEIINLARGKSIKLLDFICEIENCLDLKAKKNMMPMQAGDVEKTYADISKAERLLSYQPKTSLDTGVKNFVDWYRDYYHC